MVFHAFPTKTMFTIQCDHFGLIQIIAHTNGTFKHHVRHFTFPPFHPTVHDKPGRGRRRIASFDSSIDFIILKPNGKKMVCQLMLSICTGKRRGRTSRSGAGGGGRPGSSGRRGRRGRRPRYVGMNEGTTRSGITGARRQRWHSRNLPCSYGLGIQLRCTD